jgi:uncharacterized repeat protein (TIGR04042 family)
MPEVLFTIQLPDGITKECYSPSSVVRRYFVPGEEIPMPEFLRRSRIALTEASKRVQAKFGFACGNAAAQLDQIERWANTYPQHSVVRIIRI